MECCDNREFIVSVLSLLSNVILTSERAQVRSSLDTVRRGAREICYELASIRRWTVPTYACVQFLRQSGSLPLLGADGDGGALGV